MASFYDLPGVDIEQLLRAIDFISVRDFFALTFAVAREEAEKQHREDTAKTEFHEALRTYIKNPSRNSAISLLRKYPHLADVFEVSKTV